MSAAARSSILKHSDVLNASVRLNGSGRIYRTPTFESDFLNSCLGHRVLFKAENLQKTGAFKARGALNSVLNIIQQGRPRVVAYSSGNHAQAVAWACREASMDCTIFMPENVSTLKQRATLHYGAKLELSATRPESESLAAEAVKQGAVLIPPFDHDDVICGQGTAALEALQDLLAGKVGTQPGRQEGAPVHADAIFAPVGGGGLLSGTYLAAADFYKELGVDVAAPLVFGGEPLLGNDAAQSLRTGKIVSLPEQPKTIADGAMTMSVSERTLRYLKQTDGIWEVTDDEMKYWTQLMTHLLKMTIEPTGTLGLGAAVRWLMTQKEKKTVVVVVSGGNMSVEKRAEVWDGLDALAMMPQHFAPTLARFPLASA